MSIGQLFASVRVAAFVAIILLILSAFASMANAQPLIAVRVIQNSSANKAIYAEPLTPVIVPGEIALASVGFKGDLGEEFGSYTIKLDEYDTTPGISILGWSKLSGQERIVIRFLTDSRLQAGLALAAINVYDESQNLYPMAITFTVAPPLPNEFFYAARRVAVGSVPLYNALQGDGRVQALSNFQTKRSFKKVAEIYAGLLEKHGWTLVQNDVAQFGGVILATRDGAEAYVHMYDDPLNGDRWVTVGVTQ